MNIIYGTGLTVRGPVQAEDFSYSIAETPLVTASTTTPTIVKDTLVNRVTGTLSANNFKINVADSLLLPGHSFVNTTPSVVTVDGLGNTALITNGTAIVNVVTPVGTRSYTRSMVSSGASTQDIFQNYQTGTLGLHITNAMLALVSGKTPGAATQNRYSSATYSLTAPAAVPNPSLFASSVDLTAITLTNTQGGAVAPWCHQGLLISPRHVIGATHFPVGGTLVFQRSNGTFQTVTVVSVQDNITFSGSDIHVAYLSAAITGINPLQVMPANWRTYLPAGEIVKLPLLQKVAHDNNGNLADWVNITQYSQVADSGTSHFCTVGALNMAGVPVLATDAWFSPIIDQDSGSPVIALVNGNPVLMCAYHYANGAEHFGDHVADINSAMNSLASAAGDATSYALAAPVLTTFTAF